MEPETPQGNDTPAENMPPVGADTVVIVSRITEGGIKDEVIEGDATRPIAEAMARAMASAAHQHAAVASPVDERAPSATRLPFPRPAFDVNKHLQAIFAQRAVIRELALDAVRSDTAAKNAAKAAKNAHEDLDDAHTDLDGLIDRLEEERQAAIDGPAPEQLVLHEAGRTPCAWERAHPGQVCMVCSSGGSHIGNETDGVGRMELATGGSGVAEPTDPTPEERAEIEAAATVAADDDRLAEGSEIAAPSLVPDKDDREPQPDDEPKDSDASAVDEGGSER